MKHLVFAAILLLAAPAWAEPLETSFCKEIPDGINFGDSYDSIVEKMGRPPDTCKITATSKTLVYIYDIDLPSELGRFDLALVAYAFRDGHLTSCAFSAVTSGETDEEVQNVKLGIADFNTWLIQLYGVPAPSPSKKDTGDIYNVQKWEFANNALLISPLFNNEETAYIMAIVCPLAPNGHYDIADY